MKKASKKNSKIRSNRWKLVKKIVGFSLIFIGILGIFLPILQGIISIVIGVVLINSKPVTDTTDLILKKFNKKWSIDELAKLIDPKKWLKN